MEFAMALTEKEQREMYTNVALIKQNCVRCNECIKDHESRIKKLEQAYWWLLGGCAVLMYAIERFFN